MPSENVELVRRGYEAWNRGDVVAGRDQVRAWLERFLEAWEELEIEPTDLIEAGDRVVALVRFRALGKESKIRVEGGVDAHVWTVRDGNIVAVELYQGTREALAAVGLQRPPARG